MATHKKPVVVLDPLKDAMEEPEDSDSEQEGRTQGPPLRCSHCRQRRIGRPGELCRLPLDGDRLCDGMLMEEWGLACGKCGRPSLPDIGAQAGQPCAVIGCEGKLVTG